MKKTAVLTTLFKQPAEFTREFIVSLEKQTFKDFDLIVSWDRVAPFHLVGGVKQVDLIAPGSVVLNRKNLIKTCCDLGYENAIFCDADDVHNSNRFMLLLDGLKTHDIVFNDLALFDVDINKNVKMINRRFQGLITSKDVMESNCLGLTNTAVKTSHICEVVEKIGNNVMAFDWALFTRILLNGAQCMYIPETITYYRKYLGNMAPCFSMTELDVLRGVEVKLRHYQDLSQDFKEFKSFYDQFLHLKSKIDNDKNNLQYYTKTMNALDGTFWWENIKIIPLE